MFDWVLNTSLFIDGYYLHGLTSLYVHLFVSECLKNVASRSQCSSRLLFIIFQIQNCLFFLYPKYFYEIAVCCIIVITSCNNAILDELNNFIKSKLKVNWRKKLKPLTDAGPHIFFPENTTNKLSLDFF